MNLEGLLRIYAEGGSSLIDQLLNPSPKSSLWILLGISVIVWCLEIIKPWRVQQGTIRKDFFLDAFYMSFNFFLAPWLFLNLVFYVGQNLMGQHFQNLLPSISLASAPDWLQIFSIFLLQDFTHYWIHRLLHRVPFLWRYHKVHHSVEEMGFAAHLRFHWVENVIYQSLTAFPFYVVGFSPVDLFWVHLITLLIGHLNHANLNLTYGPFKWIVNHPVMHLWHHAEKIPGGHQYGVNYGISLSIWDLFFKTGVWTEPPADLKLGFPNRGQFPNTFWGQNLNLLGPDNPLSEDKGV